MAKFKYNVVEPLNRVRELITNGVEKTPDRAAFVYKKGKEVIEVSYSQLYDDIVALGNALAARGFIGGKHIACIGANSYKYACSYLSTISGDNVFVPIDKDLPEHDIINVVLNSDAEAILCDKKYEEIFTKNAAELPNLKLIVGLDRDNDSDGVISFDTLLTEGAKLTADGYSAYTRSYSDLDDLKLLVYTSGTTGNAKGVMLTERNLISCVYYGLHVATIYERCLSVLPYHHTYESVCNLLVSLHMRSTICINESLRVVLSNLQLYKPSYVMLVPAFAELFYKRIWASAEESGRSKKLKTGLKLSRILRKLGIDLRRKIFADIHNTFGGNLREIVCGGAPIRPEIGQFFDDIGIDVLIGYGITECSPLVSVNSPLLNDFTTAGIILPTLKVTVDNPNEDGDGEICVKGPTVMLGYYKNPQATAEVLIDGTFHTGDIGHVTAKNQVVINGRKKNLIVLKNGKNVYPEEIENYILSIPYIKEVVVASVTDESGSEVGLSAEVFLNSEQIEKAGVTADLEKVKSDITEVLSVLPAYKHVTSVTIREKEFDKTTTSKIKRNYKK